MKSLITWIVYPAMDLTKSALTYIAILGLLSISAWTITPGDLQKADWLVGTWENETSRGRIFENWIRISESEFRGRSYMINENDTLVFENIQLTQDASGVYYIPTVRDQNEGKPIRFTATSLTETQMIFENPEHDFPQMITYTKIGADSLVAEISGSINGQERRRAFPMRRVN